MSEVDQLLNRINAEFAAAKKEVEQEQSHLMEEFKGREQRRELFNQILDRLQGIIRPRLQALADRFGEHVQVKPTITPEERWAKFTFNSDLAAIELTFSAMHDVDVRNLIYSYDLEILPILMKFEKHSEIEFPLDAVDEKALAQWIDDQIVKFVRTYLDLHRNQYYLKGHMVEDPVAHVRFPPYAAAASLEIKGTMYYFISEETRRDFEQQQGSAK